MPKQIKHSHLKLHHNTWVIRYQIPRDCHQFFGKREWIKSTGYKASEILDALTMKTIEVEKIKKTIRDFRRGKIHTEPTLAQSRAEAIHDYDELDREISRATRSADHEREHALAIVQTDVLDNYVEELIEKLIPNGLKAIHKIGEETKNPDKWQIIKQHWPIAYKQIEEQILITQGKGFASRIDQFLKTRDIKTLGLKYQQEHQSKILAFAKDFPAIEGVTHAEVKLWTRKLEEDGLASATINKQLGMLSNYWRFLQEEGLAEEGLYPFVSHRIKEFVVHKRLPFGMGDAQRLIEEPTYQSNRYPYLLDFIQLGFLTGCRVKELCEIKKENIITFQNVRVINFTDGMSKKNTAGVRKVPITSKMAPLINRRMEETSSKYLFPGIRNKHEDRTGHMSKRFSAHKKTLGYQPHTEVAHSFRHTANTTLSMLKVAKEHRDQLLGWSGGGDKSMSTDTYDHYETSYPMAARKADLEKLGNEFWWISKPEHVATNTNQLDLENLL